MKLNRPSLLQLIDKKDLVGAEIGVQFGLNARNMLEILHIKKLYLIDPYMEFTEKRFISQREANKWMSRAKHELKKWDEKIIWIRKRSVDAIQNIPDNTLDFVYIDGSHTYVAATTDTKLYIPKVKMGGLVAGHDYNKKQVKRAIDDIFGDKITVENCLPVDKSKTKKDWWVWKNEDIINR